MASDMRALLPPPAAMLGSLYGARSKAKSRAHKQADTLREFRLCGRRQSMRNGCLTTPKQPSTMRLIVSDAGHICSYCVGKFMGHLRFALAIVLFLPSICVALTTAKEARTMPLPALSQKLLGESGAVMIDLDRPRFERVLEPVRFYSHATVTGSQFGICGSDWVIVDFDDKGSVEGISSERRYGVAGDIYRAPGKWSYEESGNICDSVKSTRNYFPAPDAESALEIALYVDVISGRGPFAKQKFSFQCEGMCGPGRKVLSALKLGDISEARLIDCPTSGLKFPSCFELVVGRDRLGPFPKHFRIYGSGYMNKIVISAVKVSVDSTLE